VQGRQGLTPFARWASAWGLWPLIGAALATVAAVALRAGQGPRP
jgi:apolipoprotein N-acyltransferase